MQPYNDRRRDNRENTVRRQIFEFAVFPDCENTRRPPRAAQNVLQNVPVRYTGSDTSSALASRSGSARLYMRMRIVACRSCCHPMRTVTSEVCCPRAVPPLLGPSVSRKKRKCVRQCSQLRTVAASYAVRMRTFSGGYAHAQ